MNATTITPAEAERVLQVACSEDEMDLDLIRALPQGSVLRDQIHSLVLWAMNEARNPRPPSGYVQVATALVALFAGAILPDDGPLSRVVLNLEERQVEFENRYGTLATVPMAQL